MCRSRHDIEGGAAAKEIGSHVLGEAEPHRTAGGRAAEAGAAGDPAEILGAGRGRAAEAGVKRGYPGQAGYTEQSGYTVVEVVVVLMVMAIAAAFVVPQVINYMRMYRLGVASRNIATALQRARYIATSNNTRAEVSVRGAGLIDIVQYDTQGNTEPKDVGLVVLPDGITISPEAPRNIAFDGRGVITPLPAQSPVIQVNGPSPYYSVITVSPTGQVTVGPVQSRES